MAARAPHPLEPRTPPPSQASRRPSVWDDAGAEAEAAAVAWASERRASGAAAGAGPAPADGAARADAVANPVFAADDANDHLTPLPASSFPHEAPPTPATHDHRASASGPVVLHVRSYEDEHGLSATTNDPHAFNERARRFVYSMHVQLFVTALVLFDLSLLVADFTLDANDKERLAWVDSATAAVVTLLLCELCLRFYADGRERFFRDLWNFVDAAVLVASLVLVLAGLEEESRIATVGYFGRTIRQLIRLSRVARILSRVKGAADSQAVAARRHVGGNKKRFVDASFDLDLVYITPNVIAMSCPCEGRREYYRNPLREVARFFTERHPGAYHVFNFCPELPYRHDALGGRVSAFDVQDHTPPRLGQLCRFCSECYEFLSENSKTNGTNDHLAITRVAAIHCRGGKGRTGTAIAAYLLYSGQCSTANEALDLFARRRTDLTKEGKLQGVETPSQRRYVRYFDTFLRQQRIALEARLAERGEDCAPPVTPSGFPHPIALPSARPVRLERLSGRDLLCPTQFPRADGIRLKVTVTCLPNDDASASYLVDAESDCGPVITASGANFDVPLGGFRASGDVRINLWNADEFRAVGKRKRKGSIISRFLDGGNGSAHTSGADDGEDEVCKAGKEPGILAFFWFHTAMINGDTLTLSLSQVDKANKLKQKVFNPNGQLVLKVKYAESA